MKQDKPSKDQTALIERELATIAERLEQINASLKDAEELSLR